MIPKRKIPVPWFRYFVYIDYKIKLKILYVLMVVPQILTILCFKVAFRVDSAFCELIFYYY